MAPSKASAEAAESAKRKAEEEAAEEPGKKEAKTEEEDKKGPAETEVDEPKDARPAIKDKFCFHSQSTTLNVVPSMGDRLLSSLSEGGLQYLIAGARGNIGIKSGRYMYEVKILEVLNPAEKAGVRGKPPMPRQLIRIGFSTSESQLVLGESEEHVCFDSEGAFYSGLKKTYLSQRFTRDQVIAVLLNLDPKLENNNTISLFRDGERICKPQPLPDNLHGKVLYPHVAYRNITVQMLMGPTPIKPLSFACNMVAGAKKGDAVVTVAKTGKRDLVIPVGLPDEGTFEWMDLWHKKNPGYTELSDRNILEWCVSSGLSKAAKPGSVVGLKPSNDKPEFSFGLPSIDDNSVRRVINAVAPLMPRDYVIMEVNFNLSPADRKATLKRFAASAFKRIATIAVGEPKAEFKEIQANKILKEKQEKSDAAWRERQAESKRTQLLRKAAAELEKKKKEEEAEKAKAEEVKAEEGKAAEEKKEGDADEGKMEVDGEGKEKSEEAAKAEAKEEAKEEVKEEAKEEGKEEDAMEVEEERPIVELDEEEKKTWFWPNPVSDLTSGVLGTALKSISVPEKAEGFDEVRFEWQAEAKAKEYVRAWVLERKRTMKIEDLQPSQWFNDKHGEWMKTFAAYQATQGTPKNEDEEKKEEGEGEGAAKEEEKVDSTLAADIFTIEDVKDVGNGQPLFKDFTLVDWALTMLRFEFYLLQVGFRHDVDDPDRQGIIESHIDFYYTKYFRKQMTPKLWGVEKVQEMVDLVKDTASITDGVLASPLKDDVGLDMFVKLTEEKRRERQRRIDAGDETARLKVTPQAMQQPRSVIPPANTQPAKWGGKDAGGKGKVKGVCRAYSKGRCTRGDRCPWSHS